jgi:hypothetical protein
MSKTGTGEKVKLYIVSLWFLFFSVLILKSNIPVYTGEDWEFVGIIPIITTNIVSVICVIFLLLVLIFYLSFEHKLKGTHNLSFQISNARNVDYEHLVFFETCIVPLICFNLDNMRYIIVLALVIVVIGVIYSKANTFYANPTLSLLGYRIYKIDKENNGSIVEITILTKNKLSNGDMVSYIVLDDNIYYGKKAE